MQVACAFCNLYMNGNLTADLQYDQAYGRPLNIGHYKASVAQCDVIMVYNMAILSHMFYKDTMQLPGLMPQGIYKLFRPRPNCAHFCHIDIVKP